jgi:probable phosphoglycerate mutase
VRSAKPPVLITHNDLGHLLPELRTGLPVDQPY